MRLTQMAILKAAAKEKPFNGFVTAGEDRRVGSGLIVETRTRL